MGNPLWNEDEHRQKDCLLVEEFLDEYLDKTLPEDGTDAWVEAHLATCPDCAAHAAAYPGLRDAFSAYAALPLPVRPGDWQALEARLSAASEPAPPRKSPRRRVWNPKSLAVGMAAIALAVAAVAVPYQGRENRARDAREAVLAPPKSPPSVEVKKGGFSRLMGFVTVGAGKDTLAAAPAFIGASTGEMLPLVVKVGNSGEATDAEIQVRPERVEGIERVYRYRVRLAARGVSRFLFYPSWGLRDGQEQQNPRWLPVCHLVLSAPGRQQKLSLAASTSGEHTRNIAWVGSRFGALSFPRHQQTTPATNRTPLPVSYVLPENAPDKAVGYNSFALLVLTPEASAVTDAQWQAIRDWVLKGGHLVLTSSRLLEVPRVAALAPARKQRSTGGREALIAVPGAEVLSITPATRFFRKAYGNGSIVCTDFDASTEDFRRHPDSERFWRSLLDRANRLEGRLTPYQRSGEEWAAIAGVSKENNPFTLPLPPIHSVALIFLGYFVLVVPVSFLVLKHTRRLNLAWGTAPALALLFAGIIFLLTSRLYFMPTARRSSGYLYLPPGEAQGRFSGYCELFFPAEGTHKIPFPAAESVDTGGWYGEKARALSTLSNPETGELLAEISTGRLGFRRLHFQQAVTLQGPVRVVLQRGPDGVWNGYVENRSGRPLLDSVLVLEGVQGNGLRQEENSTMVHRPGTLPVGRTTLRFHDSQWKLTHSYVANSYYGKSLEAALRSRNGLAATHYSGLKFMARTSGSDFGPRIGQDFSGEDSVMLVVGVESPAQALEQERSNQ